MVSLYRDLTLSVRVFWFLARFFQLPTKRVLMAESFLEARQPDAIESLNK